MNKHLLAAAIVALAAGAPAAHAGDPYGDALSSYKGELKRDAPDVINSEFYGTLANSQARRAVRDIEVATRDSVVDDGRSSPSSNRDPRAPSGVNIASPQVYGRVHGNVIVVVQRGAVRGSITSVQR